MLNVNVKRTAVLDKCEDSICDFMFNVTPFPPTEREKIREFIARRIQKIAWTYNVSLTENEINDKVNLLEQMYLSYCKLNEQTFGDYSA